MTQKGVAAMNIRPALDEVKTIAAAGGYKVLPVSGKILSDICTPIEARKILKNVSTHCYLLESAQPSEKWGRYTFLGLDPKMEITCRNGVTKAGALTFETKNPSQMLREILAQYKSPRFASSVFPFAAGWISDIPAASGSPPSLPSWKTPDPASGSRRVPTGGIPRPDSRTPASPVPARWSRPARCARTP